jgi:hypothetical protein
MTDGLQCQSGLASANFPLATHDHYRHAPTRAATVLNAARVFT